MPNSNKNIEDLTFSDISSLLDEKSAEIYCIRSPSPYQREFMSKADALKHLSEDLHHMKLKDYRTEHEKEYLAITEFVRRLNSAD